jgi:hypothetical protein
MNIITSKVYVSKVRTDVEPHLGEFVISDEHHIAVSNDIGKSIELRPEAKVTVPLGADGVVVKVGDSTVQMWTDVSKAMGGSATKH